MSKLFFIQNTEVKTIIIQTIATTVPNPAIGPSFIGFVSNNIR